MVAISKIPIFIPTQMKRIPSLEFTCATIPHKRHTDFRPHTSKHIYQTLRNAKGKT